MVGIAKANKNIMHINMHTPINRCNSFMPRKATIGVTIIALGFGKRGPPTKITKKAWLLSREISIKIVKGKSINMGILPPLTTDKGVLNLSFKKLLLILKKAMVQIFDVCRKLMQKLLVMAMIETRLKKVIQPLVGAHPTLGLAYVLTTL